MRLTDKELDLIDRHSVDEIVFMSRKQPKVIYDLKKIMMKYEEENKKLRFQALQQALAMED
jgi:hypothetical protein